MMSDSTKEYMFYILGLLALIIPLLREVLKGKSFLKRKIYQAIYIWFLILSFLILFWLGIDKITRDGNDKHKFQTKIESLGEKMDNIQKGKTQDSLNRISDSSKRADFDTKLLENFHIKDSANTPTYINKGKQVNVQDNHGKMDIKF